MKKARLDRRVEKTRSALFGAFAGLVQKHRYEEIGVADILERANVSRSAFYEHFSGKEGLLAGSIAGPFTVLADSIWADDNTSRLIRILEHFWANRALARAILREPVRSKTAAVLIGQIEQRLQANGLGVRGALILPTRLAAIQLAEVFLAPITAWLSAEPRCTAQTLALALRRVAAASLAAMKAPGVANGA
jgi:AcrR family transcriptional regulator